MPDSFENRYKRGLADGLPICLGYISVSFAFGISAVKTGLPWFVAVLISMTNVTSAGQLAGLPILALGGTCIEMAVTQFIINLRYALMSISLSQKFHRSVRLPDRLLIACGVTDEIFAVSSAKETDVGKRYMAGLITLPYLGWAFGTFLGAIAGDLLPASVTSALGVAIYGMFIAIFIPPAKKHPAVALVVAAACLLSAGFQYIPPVARVFENSPGFVIILCAVAAATIGALVKPTDDPAPDENGTADTPAAPAHPAPAPSAPAPADPAGAETPAPETVTTAKGGDNA